MILLTILYTFFLSKLFETCIQFTTDRNPAYKISSIRSGVVRNDKEKPDN
jgi:hypothetical protein